MGNLVYIESEAFKVGLVETIYRLIHLLLGREADLVLESVGC